MYYGLARFPTKPTLDILVLGNLPKGQLLHVLLGGPFPNEAVAGYSMTWPVSQRIQHWMYYYLARFPTKPSQDMIYYS